jgi:hypothetical protein
MMLVTRGRHSQRALAVAFVGAQFAAVVIWSCAYTTVADELNYRSLLNLAPTVGVPLVMGQTLNKGARVDERPADRLFVDHVWSHWQLPRLLKMSSDSTPTYGNGPAVCSNFRFNPWLP